MFPAVHFLTLEGLPSADKDTIQHIAVESFLLGCKDSRAAEVVIEKDPANIFDAQKLVQASANNHKHGAQCL